MMRKERMPNENRFIDIEIKILQLEKVVEDLHESMYAQQLYIQQLEIQIKKTSQQLQSFSNEIGAAGEKPPHY